MRRTGLFVLVLALSACGGSDSGTSGTPKAIAEKASCGQYQDTETSELGVSAQGSCTVDGNQVTINTFSNNEARDTWVSTARRFGGPYLVGDKFVAYSDGHPTTTQALKAKLKGDVVS